MSGIFVKLDAEYTSDDEFIEAGPLAELLFVRSLCFCKRKRIDGEISRHQLSVIAGNIPSAAKHAARLVDVGLWAITKDGWSIPSWFKHNKSAEDIIADKEARRMASVEANHAQHHVGPGKKKSPKCELCRSESAPKSGPISDANRLQEVEGEPEGEVKPQGEGEGEVEVEVEPPSSSDENLRRGHLHAVDDDDRILKAIQLHATVAAERNAASASGRARYKITTVANDMTEHYAELEAWLHDHPDITAERLAIDVFGITTNDITNYGATA